MSQNNQFLGPGPARYQLPPAIGVPNHDPRKWKAPAYSLTGGAKPFKGTGVPGKVYFIVLNSVNTPAEIQCGHSTCISATPCSVLTQTTLR